MIVNETCFCEVCGNSDLVPVLELGNHPLCGDLIPIGSKKLCDEYPIEIYFCKNCITAHQKYPVSKEKLFHYDYQYRARMTPSVLLGMEKLVERLSNSIGSLSGKKILDIGCNDGSLLDFFSEKGAITVGVEPTVAASDSKHKTINAFFENSTAKSLLKEFGKFDIITFTNVFAHIEDLNALLKNVKILLGDDSMLIIENHYLGAILEKNQFDTFYHEHPRTYSLKSFGFIAEKLSLQVSNVEFLERYGGNIRVTMTNQKKTTISVDETLFGDGFFKMKEDLNTWRSEMKAKINFLNSRHGPIPAKAFPGRAAILVKMLDLTEENISCVYEITGSKKIGFYVPGTRIPIKPEKELFGLSTKPKVILNFAWHIPIDVVKNLRANGVTSEIIHVKT